MTIRSARAIIIASIIALSISAGGLIAIYRREPLAIAEPDAAWLPGAPLPENAYCYPGYGSWQMIFCSDPATGVSVRYDGNLHVITHTMKLASHLTAGELINAWGTPTDAGYYKWFVYIDWGSRYAVIYSDALRVDDLVSYIAFDYGVPVVAKNGWRGFIGGR